MQDLRTTIILRQHPQRILINFGLLVIMVSILLGCAVDRQAASTPAISPPPVQQGPAVQRLSDGRRGFTITEIPQMNEDARRDFDHAVFLLSHRQYDQAIDLLQKVILQSPGVTAPYINLAIACRYTGKIEQAEAHLKTALQLVPEHPVASNEYGILYRKTGRFTEARAVYEKSLSRFPDYYLLHKNLAILCDLYLGDWDCALEHYEKYSQAIPEDKQVKAWIADLRLRLDRK